MKCLLSLLILALICSCSSQQNKVYQWRGNGRSGIYPDTDLLKVWPQDGPDEIWSVEGIGSGYGSPVFAGNRFYITGAIDSMAVLHCFTLEGEKQWQTAYGKEWITSFPGSRSAPTIVGDLIYVGTGMGNLYCIEKMNGTVIWSKDFHEDFQGIYPLHGHAEAAVVDGDRIFWTPGGEVHNVVAMDRFSGEVIWSNPGHGERSAYNTGNLIKLPNRSIYVTFSAYHLMGFDVESGEMLWFQEQDNLPVEQRDLGYGDTHPNSVIYEDGYIYYVVSDGNDAVKLALSEDGSEIDQVWRTTDFDSFMGGIVKIGNYIYGTGDSKKQLNAMDATSGLLTDSLKIGWGAIIAADEMLYYYNQRGEVKLISYDQGKMQEISSFKIKKGTKEHFSHPVIHQGILYQRHGQVLMAFDVRNDQV